MKKILLLLGAIALSKALMAQTVIFSEDFESYQAGDQIAESNASFYTWTSNSPNMDAPVSDAYAASGSNSIELAFADGTDIVLSTGEYAQNIYTVDFKILIPEGEEGYFNLLHDWNYTSAVYEWAIDVNFANGNMTWVAGATEGGAGSYTPGEWQDIQVQVNLANDFGVLSLNGEEQLTWQWSLDNADGSAGMNEFEAVNFFAWGPSENTGLYYVDDITITEEITSNLDEQEYTKFKLYPNPAKNHFILETTTNVDEIVVISSSGQLVKQWNLAQSEITPFETSDLESGIYYVQIVSEGKYHVMPLVIE
ncbi:MAG: T9SS type A sorting domain-containing protein [Flavobacteriales bacterium]|nr:T9SS type A sorting domain-containing protein [Flavobacteriales bacterium]